MSTSFQLTFDAADPNKLSTFWAEILGYTTEDPPEGFDTWQGWLEKMNIPKENWNDAAVLVDPEGRGARIFFQRVPEPKTAKNRVHLDVNAGGPRGTPEDERARNVSLAVERAVAAGATKLYDGEQYGSKWVTLADPEGNEFCIQ